LSLSLTLGLVVLSAACNQTANHGNMPINHNGMNHNGMNHNSMEHNAMNSNSAMNHSEMMKSDANAASAPYDLQFIDTMAHHHQGAIEMSEMVLKKSNNEELKKFAQKIIDDQRKEIAEMKQWREKWYGARPPAKNMEMPGMMDSMKMMQGEDMKMMESAIGKDFDLAFLAMMSPHHEGAVAMAKDAFEKAEHQEIKTLAQNIIKAQDDEIKQMEKWKADWSK
jgi:uncharacterized protein (DUF305 family)